MCSTGAFAERTSAGNAGSPSLIAVTGSPSPALVEQRRAQQRMVPQHRGRQGYIGSWPFQLCQ